MSKKARVFSRGFKLMVVRRMLVGENVAALAREVKVLRKDLYIWRDRFRSGGAQALRGCGRPPKASAAVDQPGELQPDVPAAELDRARARTAELERKIGQQQVELDFFRQALRQVKGARRRNAGPGVTGSTRSSRR
ncbi:MULTISPECIES: leucine zipper domain-containing protein [Bradyrhizobium]|uniref:leucine zipper domain-containing protein n=1 Tax=Bradyrhizobium TaxID=374 RepID=UPI002714D541|nr:leucine zipper domain-containing protein [Bradyrhizobium elkanii]WLA46707.1 leucine zipper domain-containing protein [Bradyrhizobium elkanii]WLB83011.1 leucine zipper domain-containing protein [Bradyrhizobium elkanii]